MQRRLLGFLAVVACAVGLSGCVAVDGGHYRHHGPPSHHGSSHSSHHHH